jgi:hypothetical protein
LVNKPIQLPEHIHGLPLLGLLLYLLSLLVVVAVAVQLITLEVVAEAAALGIKIIFQ